MPVRMPILWFVATVLLCLGAGPAASNALKRPYDVPDSQFEIGSFLIYQKGPSGLAEMGTFTPIKWTKFVSDSLDLKFEGSFSYSWQRGSSWRSFTAAPGFRYWIDGSTNVTPFVRVGFARAQPGGATLFAYGADIMLQRTFTLDPQVDDGTHRFIVAETQAGFMTYVLWGTRFWTRHGFVAATTAYDWPIWQASWNAEHRNRAKIGFGFETRFDPGGRVGWLFLAALSFRSEHPDNGRLIRKVDISAAVGMKGQHRLSVGFTHGF